MVVLSPNFSSRQNPQFQKPVTLNIVHGQITCIAQKRNQLLWLALKLCKEQESTIKMQ